jgi:hypothetical protein
LAEGFQMKRFFRNFVLAAKQAWKARQRLAILPVSKARTNKFYIYRQCTYIVYLFVYFFLLSTNFVLAINVIHDKVVYN